MKNIKCICSDVISKHHDGQSKKMMQAQMLKAPKSYKLKYSNSANDTITQVILSNDYESNKGLLLCYKFDRYSELIAPLILKYPKINILGLLNEIIENLQKPEEYNSVFKIKPIVPIISDPQLIYENKKTFYVVVADLFGYNSFIFKNYTNDVLIPTYSYTFNLEHESNLNTKLSFSVNKNWIPYTHLTYNGVPGTPGSYAMITIPQSINIGQLYIYNATDANVGNNYLLWGYNTEYLSILLDSIKNTVTSICKNIETNMFYQKIPKIDENNIIDTFTTVCLPRSSILLINNSVGAKLYIDDVLIRQEIGYYINNKYGLYQSGETPSIYYMYVPQKFELAFLNKNNTNFTYTGDETKKSIGTIEGTADDYNFYYGTIRINIKGSFQPISIYTKNYGYLNCYNIIIYSDKCSTVLEDNNPYLIPY